MMFFFHQAQWPKAGANEKHMEMLLVIKEIHSDTKKQKK